MKRLLCVPLLLICFLSACSKMQISDFEGASPEFRLEEYFQGKTKAWGIVHDRFGDVRRQFTVEIQGQYENNILTLTEDFLYDDGERQQRIWKISKVDDHRYRGTADDVIGSAQGAVYGNALHWQYYLNLKMADDEYMVVHFDDWMFLQDDGVLLNKAVMSKWGIRLAEVTLSFQKIPESD